MAILGEDKYNKIISLYSKEELIKFYEMSSNNKVKFLNMIGINYNNGRISSVLKLLQNYLSLSFYFIVRPIKEKIQIDSKECLSCKKLYIPNKKFQKTCSVQCSNLFYSEIRHGIKTVICEKCSKTINISKQSSSYKCLDCRNQSTLKRKERLYLKRKNIQKKCLLCHTEFIGGSRQNYCSMKCITQKRRNTNSFKGWNSRFKIKPSYPEQYFINLFEKENIKNYTRELHVGKYFIDFAFGDIKLALEIDGKQHEYEDRKKKDILKDEFLKKEGWDILRIKWVNPINEINKIKLYSQIDNFKKIISSKKN